MMIPPHKTPRIMFKRDHWMACVWMRRMRTS